MLRTHPLRTCSGVLLLVAFFLLVAQWEMYPPEFPGQTNAIRTLGLAVVIGLSALRLATSHAFGPHRIVTVAITLSGVLLVLNGILADHAQVSNAVAEAVCGLIVLVVAAVVFRADRATHQSSPRVATDHHSEDDRLGVS